MEDLKLKLIFIIIVLVLVPIFWLLRHKIIKLKNIFKENPNDSIEKRQIKIDKRKDLTKKIIYCGVAVVALGAIFFILQHHNKRKR
jgi:hypothetical protein